MKLAIAILVLACPTAFAQKFDVKIVDQQDNETDYTYVVPGHFSSQSNSSANCYGSDSSVNCNGSTTTSGFSTPAQQVSYHVRGATLTLQLPDGRVAIVNCESKFKERFAGRAGNHRSCRRPLVDNIQADFHGDNAKLEWNVSLDGKKTQTETYKILAVLDKPKNN
jgi:predicted porin